MSAPSPTQLDAAAPKTLSPEEAALRKVLQRVGLGHLFPVMQKQTASLEALRAFGYGDFATIFSMDVGSAHKLMKMLEQAGAPFVSELWVQNARCPSGGQPR